MVKPASLFGLLAVLLCSGGCDQSPDKAAEQGRRGVVDLVGRTVSVPAQVKRVACLVVSSYEKVLLLGQGAKVVIAAPSNPLWSNRVEPHRPKLTALAHAQAPNIEDLLARRIDVVFFRNDPSQLDKLTAGGLAPVVALAFGGRQGRPVDDIDSFAGIVKDEVRLYGEVLGGDAPKAAAAWIAYYDAKVKFVRDRVADIPEEQRPKVYGVMGPTSTRSYGHNENSPWYVEMAGGRMVTKGVAESGGIDVSLEQIIAWNPDVVYIGHAYAADAIPSYATDLVTGDPRWANIGAVRDGRVFVLPVGVDYWDRDSEGVLLMEFFAKKFYPDRFADLDMVAEVKDYYARFYHYALSDAEARQILGGR